MCRDGRSGCSTVQYCSSSAILRVTIVIILESLFVYLWFRSYFMYFDSNENCYQKNI